MKTRLINESDDLSKIGKSLSKDPNPMVKKVSHDIVKTSLNFLKEEGDDKSEFDILKDFNPSSSEMFNIDIMDKMVFGEPHLNNPDPILKSKYNLAIAKADELFGYHQNEDILNFIYLEYVIKTPEFKEKYISLMKKYNGGKKTKFDQDKNKQKLEEPFIKETTGSASSGAYAGAAFVAGSKWLPAQKPIYNGGIIIKPNRDTHDMGVNSFKIIKEEIIKENTNMEDYILNPEFAENMLKSINEDAKPQAILMKDELGKENEQNFKKDMSDYDEQIEKATNVAVKSGEKTTIEPVYETNVEVVDEKKFDSDGKQREIMLNRGGGLEDVKFDIEPGKEYLDRMKQQMGDDKFKEREEKAKFRSEAPMYNKDVQPVKIVKESTNVTASFIDGKGSRQVIEFDNNKINSIDKIDESYFKLTIGGFGVGKNKSLNEESEKFSFFINRKNEIVKTVKNLINEESESFNKMKHLFNYNSKSYLRGKK